MNSPTVICRYSNPAGQWQAWFEGPLNVPSGGSLPRDAVRALLEKNGVPAGTVVTLKVDRDMAGSGVLTRTPTWEPPELRFPCERCRGTGEFRSGLGEPERCGACKGRGWLAG